MACAVTRTCSQCGACSFVARMVMEQANHALRRVALTQGVGKMSRADVKKKAHHEHQENGSEQTASSTPVFLGWRDMHA